MTHEICEKLEKKGMRVPDLAIAGGFSTEDHIFKVLSMGAPYVKSVCMGRAFMIPGMVGKNIGYWIEGKALPQTVSRYGKTPNEIFVCYDELAEKYGKEIKDIPLGAIGIYSISQKLKVGLQQLMAGSRNFNLSTISRKDVAALTEEAAKVSGIPHIMDAYREEAEKVLDSEVTENVLIA